MAKPISDQVHRRMITLPILTLLVMMGSSLPTSRVNAQTPFDPFYMLNNPDRGFTPSEVQDLDRLYSSNGLDAVAQDGDIIFYCRAKGGTIKGPVVEPQHMLTGEEMRKLAGVTADFIMREHISSYTFIAIDETKLGGKITSIQFRDSSCN